MTSDAKSQKEKENNQDIINIIKKIAYCCTLPKNQKAMDMETEIIKDLKDRAFIIHAIQNYFPIELLALIDLTVHNIHNQLTAVLSNRESFDTQQEEQLQKVIFLKDQQENIRKTFTGLFKLEENKSKPKFAPPTETISNDQFLAYVKGGDIKSVNKELLRDKSILSQKIDGLELEGLTFLHAAVIKDRKEIVKILLQHMTTEQINAPYEFKNKDGVVTEKGTVLHLAVKHDKRKISKILLNDVRVNLSPLDQDKFTPFHRAATKSDPKLISWFLKKLKPAELNMPAIGGHRALHLAIVEGNLPTAQVILDDPRVEVNLQVQGGHTVLHLAAEIGNLNMVRSLLTKMSRTTIDSANNKNCYTALHIAVRKGHTEIVNLLLSHMSPEAINSVDIEGRTVLYFALQNHELAKKLLQDQRVQNINAQTNKGWAALHYAVWSNNLLLVQLLLSDSRLQLDVTLKTGYTALELAVSYNNLQMVIKILEKMPRKEENITTKSIGNALFLAIINKNIKIVRALLESKKIDINTVIELGSALHAAVGVGNTEIVKLLLDNEIDITQKNSFGDTPLGLANKQSPRNTEIIRLLSEKIPEQKREKSEKPNIFTYGPVETLFQPQTTPSKFDKKNHHSTAKITGALQKSQKAPTSFKEAWEKFLQEAEIAQTPDKTHEKTPVVEGDLFSIRKELTERYSNRLLDNKKSSLDNKLVLYKKRQEEKDLITSFRAKGYYPIHDPTSKKPRYAYLSPEIIAKIKKYDQNEWDFLESQLVKGKGFIGKRDENRTGFRKLQEETDESGHKISYYEFSTKASKGLANPRLYTDNKVTEKTVLGTDILVMTCQFVESHQALKDILNSSSSVTRVHS